jgi:hypothetical protein
LIAKSIGTAIFGNHQATAPFFVAARDVLPLFVSWVCQFSAMPAIAGYGVATILICFLFIKRRTSKVQAESLLLFLLIPLSIILLFRRGALDQVFVIIGPSVAVGMGWLLSDIYRRANRIGLGVAALIVYMSVSHALESLPLSKDVFFQAPQPHITYQKQQDVLSYVYATMGSSVFELQSYTIPYFWQDGWQYLFWRYTLIHPVAKVPVEHGVKDLIVIIQRDAADPLFQKNWYDKTVSTWGDRLSAVTIGEYVVEHRQYP